MIIGVFQRKKTPNLLPAWKMCLMYMNARTTPGFRLYAWMKSRISFSEMLGVLCRWFRAVIKRLIRNTCATALSVYLPLLNRLGTHHVSVREHRTAVDWAEEIHFLVDEMYPDAEKIVLVMDNLNTHKPSSLYKRYPAEEARRILKKLEIHYTPKHGSWLNIAEIELNVMTRQCLSRRIDQIDKLRRELQAWELDRNSQAAKVNWHFRTSDARIKLASLYPKFDA